MAVMSRMLPLVAFSTFAILVLALLATPTNALSNQPHAHVARGHDAIAKRKRSPVKRAKRCRPKSSPLTSVTTSVSAAPSDPATTKPASSDPVTTPAPSKTPSASPAKATTTSSSVSYNSGGSGGGANIDSNRKLLLPWASGPTYLEQFTGSRVGGMYTWSPWCPDNASKLNIPCFPQLWGTKQKTVFEQQVKTDNCGLIFGFNEPNQGDQANMSPEDAARLWKSDVEPLRKKGCKLVSPATTSAPDGIDWMKKMLDSCAGGCTFDYVALHWYGTKISDFQAYVDKWANTFGKPIIVSEYACQNFGQGAQCTPDETEAFHYTMGSWFDNNPKVAMYGPFGFLTDMVGVNEANRLMTPGGKPTALGAWYLNH